MRPYNPSMTMIIPRGETIVTTGRIRLSHLSADDVAAMPWIGAALAPDWKLDALIGAVGSGAGVLISDGEDVPVGLAIVLLDKPGPKAATIPVISIDPTRRFRGLGSDASIALERYLRDQYGVEAVYAPVPDGRGLAVYFWLRQGYRPLKRVDAPGPLIGLTPEPRPGIWMVRDRL